MTPVLQTENLIKRYGSFTAVKNLSLQVEEGEVFGLLGPNGAGKTTSILMMTGLMKPDGGRVTIHGKPVSSGDRDVITRVGVCPQEIILWERLTCIEQLQFIGEMYGLKSREARGRGDRLLRDLDLASKRDQQVQKLSGGMKRRLNLLMALVHNPEVVVLDEPEAGLDPQSRVLVRDYIRTLSKKNTVILTTHNMDEAERIASRVAIIDHGELLVIDTPEKLKRRLGEGDVLEIGLREPLVSSSDWKNQGDLCEQIRQILINIPNIVAIVITDEILSIRVKEIIQVLPLILDKLSSAGLSTKDFHLRENTLEDVFIQLTGRRLRE